MRVSAAIEAVILEQRGHLFPWLPVAMACGIGLFFALTFEPSVLLLYGMAGAGALCLLIAPRLGEGFSPFAVLIAMTAIGFALAGYRAHSVAGPVLDWRYYGPVEGRVIGIDRSASDAMRLTLDQVVLSRVGPQKTPERVRVSLHGIAADGHRPRPGQKVMTTAHLSPPGGPVEPGGFDFQRHAWFGKLGAVGYTRVPVLAIEEAEPGIGLAIFRVRMAISAHVRGALPGDVGGFAAAVTTGDRSGMSADALEALRASNTAHLLAISGLHMGLLSAFVFGLLRYSFALMPWVALRWPTRNLSAIGALIVAAGYLMLSGGNVATERAFVMAAVALTAIVVNRRALSIRAVAIAALIVLTMRPETLLAPGFQMSFAATTALVAVFGWMRDAKFRAGPDWLQPVIGVVVSSAVAGLATAPIGAAHFNAIAHYGLLANLLSVPLMGLLVVPAAVLAALLAPVGLQFIGLWLMGLGLRWILLVAETVAALDGARSFVAGPPSAVLPLVALGLLFVILWQGRARWIGVAPAFIGMALWQVETRPAILIAETGGLVGVMTAEGRAISKARGAGFIASNWLENDGDSSTQAQAAERWPSSEQPARIMVGETEIIHLSGKKAVRAFKSCRPGQLIVASVPLERTGCVVLDPDALRRTGAIAIDSQVGRLVWLTTRAVTGTRLWSRWPEETGKRLARASGP
ncbi:MAG: ComEC/Rec2 family competence protein [Pseudomonadota bacterium]